MDYCLQAEHLKKNYDRFSLDVDLCVPVGSVVGLIGENGAGKTTTIKLALGLIRKDGGSFRLFGKAEGDASARQEVGVVFDECRFHELFTPKEIAAILRKVYVNWDDDLFSRYLSRFDLPIQPVKAYSRGMKMKLSIAAALAHHPRLLLLDEATSGLDPVVRDEILEVFFELMQEERNGILMSSHITGDLEKLADYISFIHKGRVALAGEKDQLLEEFKLVKCGAAGAGKLTGVVALRRGEFGVQALVRGRPPRLPGVTVEKANLEDIMLLTIKGEKP